MANPIVRITFVDDSNNTQVIRLDVADSLTHGMSQTVTDNPIERGADVSDHATPDLDTVAISVIISNEPTQLDADDSARFEEVVLDIPVYIPTPVPTPGALTGAIKAGIGDLLSSAAPIKATVLLFDEGLNRPRSFYEAFKFLRDQTILVRVLTKLRDYDDMVVTSVSAVRDSGTGTGAAFDLSFREINLVSTQQGVVEVNPSELRAFKKQALGSKSTKEAKSQQKSVLLLGAQKAGIVS